MSKKTVKLDSTLKEKIRNQYVQGLDNEQGERILYSLDQLASEYNIGKSTLYRHAKADGWKMQQEQFQTEYLKNSLVTQPFGGFSPGQKIKLSPQKTYFVPVTAPSFRSGHGASSAVDFSTASATNEQYRWLAKNGWFYGFIRVVKSEPWHFKYSPGDAQKGPTAILPYKYDPGKSYENTLNRWNNVFGAEEPNWGQELAARKQITANNPTPVTPFGTPIQSI